jgi:hypothetical protein
MKKLLLVAAFAAALSGCATKQFAQVGQVTDFEKTSMSCREIDLEIAKTQGQQHAIDKQAEFSGLDVLAFLGDWGIGNAIAHNSAQKTVDERMADLNNLRGIKNCSITTTGAL